MIRYRHETQTTTQATPISQRTREYEKERENMTKTNTTNNATANTNASKTAKNQPIPTMSKETMQGKTNKELREYIDTYFTDNVLARFNLTRPNDRAKKADLMLFIADLYNAITTAKNERAQTAPVAASAKPAPTKKPVPAKKTAPAKTDKKDQSEPVETQTRTSRKEREFAIKFPDFIERQVDDTMVKYTKCDDLYHTIDDIRKANDDGYTLLFACFWSPRLLKQFDYKAQFDVDNVPKAFPDNLDVAELLLTCDTMPKLFALSLETEAMYAFREEDLEPVDGIRVSAGLEFEIYQHKDAE